MLVNKLCFQLVFFYGITKSSIVYIFQQGFTKMLVLNFISNVCIICVSAIGHFRKCTKTCLYFTDVFRPHHFTDDTSDADGRITVDNEAKVLNLVISPTGECCRIYLSVMPVLLTP